MTDYTNFSEAELASYKVNRTNLFKGTIAVSVIYGVLALLLLIVAVFDIRGRQLLSEDFMPFTVTFVGGMIVVIILLVVQINTFKPKKFQQGVYDRDVCPDYWKAVPVEENEIFQNADATDKALMRVKCVPDKSIYEMNSSFTADGTIKRDGNVFTEQEPNIYGYAKTGDVFYKPVSDAEKNEPVTQHLLNVHSRMYGEKLADENNNAVFSSSNVRCDMFFPSILAKEDELKYQDNPNTLRCRYKDLCGLSWSSVCP